MKFNTDKIGSSAKKLGTKDSFKTILWLMAIFAVLFFGKKLFSFIKGLFDWGGKESEENLAIIQADKAYFDDLTRRFKWSATGVSDSVLNGEVARAIQYMSGYTTNWIELNRMITGMSGTHFIGFYIRFGSRINDEFSNQAGDFVEWINFEKSNSPMSLLIDQAGPIKNYLNKSIIPTVTAYNGMAQRLNKINNK